MANLDNVIHVGKFMDHRDTLTARNKRMFDMIELCAKQRVKYMTKGDEVQAARAQSCLNVLRYVRDGGKT